MSAFDINKQLTTPASNFNNSKRSYLVSHQEIYISRISFSQNYIFGTTELTIHPTDPELRYLELNFKQGKILDVNVAPLSASFKSTMCHFCCGDPVQTLFTAQEESRPILNSFHQVVMQKCSSAELDGEPLKTADSSDVRNSPRRFKSRGELTVILPPELWPTIKRLEPFNVVLNFEFKNPSAGYYFVRGNVDEGDETVEEPVFLFTAFSNNYARLCFPCMDCYSQPCTWTIIIRVPREDMIAISTGRLLQICHAPDDILMKEYYFYLKEPVAAPFIGFAVGSFTKYQDPHRQEFTHFCPSPSLLPLLKYTVTTVSDIVEYYEELLGSRMPFSSLQMVFVDNAYEEVQVFASMLILSTQVLFHPRLIDETLLGRKVLARSLARLFFGCFISADNWCSIWLPWGMALYIASLYEKKTFGVSEYRHYILTELNQVTQYEDKRQVIALDPSRLRDLKQFPFNPRFSHTSSPHYMQMYRRKAHLVIRMLEQRLGEKVVLLVIKKVMCVASAVVEENRSKSSDETTKSSNGNDLASVSKKYCDAVDTPGYLRRGLLSSGDRGKLMLTTNSFQILVSQVTGEDISKFLEQWVFQAGHLRIKAKYSFNRKRNVIEMEVIQDVSSKCCITYSGPITVLMQEIDGSYQQDWKLDENRKVFELQCHAKGKKMRKKHIPVSGGVEKNMDLSSIDAADSSVLWLRLDPDLYLFGRLRLIQADYMWCLMLRYEADCLAELQAIQALKYLPYTNEAYVCLVEKIRSERVFHRVRAEACHCLVKLCNDAPQKSGQDFILIDLFHTFYGQPDCDRVVRKNDFMYFPAYFLQCQIVLAIAKIRNRQKVCPREVIMFLLELSKLNDNTYNWYSDCHYRSALLQALMYTLSQSVISNSSHPSLLRLPTDVKQIVEEVTLRINLDCLCPSHRRLVTRACLRTFRELQKCGFLPVDANIFKQHCSQFYPYKVRLTAFECLVDYVCVEKDHITLMWLMTCILGASKGPTSTGTSYLSATPIPPMTSFLKYNVIRYLTENDLFRSGQNDSYRDQEEVLHRLWRVITMEPTVSSLDPRLRGALADLYLQLFGSDLPSCIGGEKLSIINSGGLGGRGRRFVEDIFEEQDGLLDGPDDMDAKMMEIGREFGDDDEEQSDVSTEMASSRDSDMDTPNKQVHSKFDKSRQHLSQSFLPVSHDVALSEEEDDED